MNIQNIVTITEENINDLEQYKTADTIKSYSVYFTDFQEEIANYTNIKNIIISKNETKKIRKQLEKIYKCKIGYMNRTYKAVYTGKEHTPNPNTVILERIG